MDALSEETPGWNLEEIPNEKFGGMSKKHLETFTGRESTGWIVLEKHLGENPKGITGWFSAGLETFLRNLWKSFGGISIAISVVCLWKNPGWILEAIFNTIFGVTYMLQIKEIGKIPESILSETREDYFKIKIHTVISAVTLVIISRVILK